MLSIVNYTDTRDFARLGDAWRKLMAADTGAGLCNSFAWAENWLHHFWLPHYALRLTLVMDGDEPVALLPLYHDRREGRVRFLGSGEPEHCEVASEYLDFLVDPAYQDQQALYATMAGFLETGLDAPVEMVNCLENSHARRVCRQCRYYLEMPVGRRFRLDLARSFEELCQDFSRNQRRKSRELLNRFDRQDSLHFKRLPDRDYAVNWQTLKRLHTRAWNERGETGAFVDEKFNRFHHRLHREQPQLEQRFYCLLEGDEPVAINHYYEFHNTLHFYTSGADRHAATHSPGTLLHLLCLRALSGNPGFYDLMKGSLEGSYKNRFCESDATLFDLVVFPRKLGGRSRHAAARMRRLASRIKRDWLARRQSRENTG